MSEELLWLGRWLLGGILGGGGFTLVLVPAIKYWLGKGYVERGIYEKHIKDFEAYKQQCTDDAERVAKQTRDRIADLAQQMHLWLVERDKDRDRLKDLETKTSLFWKMIEESTANFLKPK